MEPLISIHQLSPRRSYAPGEPLKWEYQIDAVDAAELQAVETSVLWYTEGKGEEDLGVHFFVRRTSHGPDNSDLRELQRHETVLPLAPWSYSGVILKIRWCIRVRVFLPRGRQFLAEQSFHLGPLVPNQVGVSVRC